MTRVLQEIPKIGLVMEAVKVVRWLKAIGDPIRLGDPLLEVETEKSVVEIEATVAGVLAQILLVVDQEATVGDPLAWIETEGSIAAPAPRDASVVAPAAAPAPPAAPLSSAATARPTERLPISPAARRLASEHDLALAAINGSGPRGRIELDDVRRALASAATDFDPSHSTDAPTPGLTPMRRALARAMTISNATIPQFPVERDVDWTALQAARGVLNAQLAADAARLSVNDFLLQAIAQTLLAFPALNATFTGAVDAPDAGITPSSGAHIGLVLAVEGGLVVPVLHQVELWGLAEIAQRRSACVERGLKGVLKREELAGATFSLSNLGSQGPDRFTALINPPQSAILAVGRQRDAVTVHAGQVAIRPVSTLTLTVDHRVADGRLASEFLAGLVQRLEHNDWRLHA